LWQSTLFAAGAGALTLALRTNHARARYWLWLAASLKFLVPFSLLVDLGGHFGWLSRNHAQAPAVFPVMIGEIGQPFAQAVFPAPSPAAPVHNLLPALLVALWLMGFTAVVFAWWRRWRRVARILRHSAPVIDGREFEALRRHSDGGRIELRSTESALEPGVFGVFRPALLWPAGISARLADAQIDAIIAHEMCHVRRRDNLAAALHMVVEATFWFHPLVWWLGTRLVDERERACDEEVLRLGNEPEVYAESLLKTCRFCLESPLLCTSGVLGSSITKRIEGIMSPAIARRLNIGRKLLLATAGLAAVAVPIWIGLLNAPRSLAQSKPAEGTHAEFDVASIKPAASGGGPFAFAYFSLKRGRFDIENMPLQTMIQVAFQVQGYQITGGPGWISSDLYEVTARSEGNPTTEQTRAMVQTLLADRFKLVLHRETKELPIYNLVAAKNGLKLQRSKDGDCVVLTPDMPRPGLAGAPSKPCGLNGGRGIPELRGERVTMAQLTPRLSLILGHAVIDKTGFTGAFNIHLRWTPDEAIDGPLSPRFGGAAPDPDGPSIFTAFRDDLGLILQPAKGPVEILVIDHIERPSEN
jgi:uncharacterized protein (TIGR03435 family)